MPAFAARILQNSLFRNTIALYGVQFFRKLVPLFTIPYLARVLGPSGWGTVAFVLSFAGLLVILIEFGFTLSATREIARHRESADSCRDIVAGVVGLQIAIFGFAAIGSFLISRFLPVFDERPGLLLAALLFAFAQGFAPLWYLQGMERMQLAASLDISGKVLSLVCLLLLVHNPSDDWKVVVLQAIAPGLCTVAGLSIVYRTVPFRIPSIGLMRDALQKSWPMFLFRSGTALYGASNVFVLGFFASPTVVGYFAGAEKINSALYGLLTPVQDALYPRLSHLMHTSKEAGARLARVGSGVIIALGFCLGAFIFVAAPLLVSLLMGQNFEPAVRVLRILSTILPSASIAMSIGTQWLLPAGRDREANFVIIGGGLFNIVLACILAPRFAQEGMAWGVSISEALIAICMIVMLRRTSRNFNQIQTKPLVRKPERLESI